MNDLTYPHYEEESNNDYCPYVLTGHGRATEEERNCYETIRDNK